MAGQLHCRIEVMRWKVGKILIRRVYALAVAYLLQVLIALCGLAFPFMLKRFWKYEAVFYCSFSGFSFIAFPVHRLTVSLRRSVMWGTITGYIAGLISVSLTPLFEGRHLHDLLHAWKMIGMDLFVWPVITLCWLIGICFGLTLVAQDRKILAKQTQELVNKLAALGIAGPPIQ